MGRGNDGKDEAFRVASDPRDRGGGALPLRFKLPFIGEMGDLAAPAVRIDRAVRHGAPGRGLQHFPENAHGVAFLDERRFRPHGLSRQRARHEEGKSFVFPYAFPVDAQIVDPDVIYAARADGDPGFHRPPPVRRREISTASLSSGERDR